MESKHYAYMLRCADNTIYSGYTNNLEKRVGAHNSGKGAKYTKIRRPVVLVYYESFDTKSEAMAREYQFKHLKKQEKEDLIKKRKKNAKKSNK